MSDGGDGVGEDDKTQVRRAIPPPPSLGAPAPAGGRKPFVFPSPGGNKLGAKAKKPGLTPLFKAPPKKAPAAAPVAPAVTPPGLSTGFDGEEEPTRIPGSEFKAPESSVPDFQRFDPANMVDDDDDWMEPRVQAGTLAPGASEVDEGAVTRSHPTVDVALAEDAEAPIPVPEPSVDLPTESELAAPNAPPIRPSHWEPKAEMPVRSGSTVMMSAAPSAGPQAVERSTRPEASEKIENPAAPATKGAGSASVVEEPAAAPTPEVAYTGVVDPSQYAEIPAPVSPSRVVSTPPASAPTSAAASTPVAEVASKAATSARPRVAMPVAGAKRRGSGLLVAIGMGVGVLAVAAFAFATRGGGEGTEGSVAAAASVVDAKSKSLPTPEGDEPTPPPPSKPAADEPGEQAAASDAELPEPPLQPSAGDGEAQPQTAEPEPVAEPEPAVEPEPEPAVEPEAAQEHSPSEPIVTDAKVAAQLEKATAALDGKRYEIAYDLAEQVQDVLPGNASLRIMALAACHLGEAPDARHAYRQLVGRTVRRGVTDDCIAARVRIHWDGEGWTSKELLARANAALESGEFQDAYDLAKESHQKKRRSEAVALMARAACNLGDGEEAKRLYVLVSGRDRPLIEPVCAAKGITLGE